jgi:predicted transcriptional regulator
MFIQVKAKLGPLESEIMDIVWQSRGPITVRAVADILTKNHKCAYTTIMTVMSRLEKKGILKCRKNKGRKDYEAILGREAFARKRSRQVLSQLVGEYGETAMKECEEFLKNKKTK